MTPTFTVEQYDTTPTALVAPNGYRGFKALIYKCGGRWALSHKEVRIYMIIVVGADVGKVNLEVSVSEGPMVRFDNTVEGVARRLRHLGEHGANLVVCEASGGYERLVVGRLRKVRIPVHVAHPNRVRAFARACDFEAKTDPRDAQVPSHYGRVFPDAHTPEREDEP